MVSAVRMLSGRMTLLFARTMDIDNPNFVQHMRYVLDPSNSFYREYDRGISTDLVKV